MSGRKLYQIFTHDLQGNFSKKETIQTAAIACIAFGVGYLLDKNNEKNKWQTIEETRRNKIAKSSDLARL